MKKSIKYTIISIILIAIAVFFAGVVLNIINDKNKLTVEEKKWLNTNLSTLQSINVLNNSPIFGNSGYGVFFDFISDFTKEYQIKINPITYNVEENVDNGFKLTNNINDDSVVFYSDYYVLIGKTYEHIKDIKDLKDKSIGVISQDSSYLSSYIKDISLVSYNSYAELNQAFENAEQIKYIIVPKSLYIDYTIKNNYEFLYHFNDVNSYYIYQMKQNDMFSTIIKKYFNNWKKDHLEKDINSNLLNTIVSNANLSEADMKDIRSKVYQYGFINNSPYEVLLGGNYGGIVSEYLQKFSNLTGVEFKFTRYKNISAFSDAINNNQVDLYFNYYNTNNNFNSVDTGMNVNYVIIAKNNNDVVINSLSSLQGKKVTVLKDSILNTYISSINGIEINTYQNEQELRRIANKDNIIMLDKETYNYLSKTLLSKYTVRYTSDTDSTYNFKVKNNDSFYKLFNKYIMVQSPEYIRLKGLYNHEKTIKKGSIYGKIAMYILIILVSLTVLLSFMYKVKKSRKIKISKKIRKEDRIRFIDQLTSLKNRNYLNEYIDSWNKNKIYPQATIIIDLNKIQEINDTKGYDEGDRQIKAASNILIRTQLDNSDIMRTDGNEFLIYTIGYDKRKIESYIRKLIKEFKTLPYDYNAIITYAMIETDVKTIEDAINEAVDDMKEKKQEI